MEVTLRRARVHDDGAVAEIHLLADAESMPYLPECTPTRRHEPSSVGSSVASYEVVVAESEGQVVGFAALGAEFLEHLYVLPRFQGRGVGSALLERAKELRPEGFRLWVFQRNEEARRFYERRGLRLVELTDGAGNEEQEPDALYEWRPASRWPAATDESRAFRRRIAFVCICDTRDSVTPSTSPISRSVSSS